MPGIAEAGECLANEVDAAARDLHDAGKSIRRNALPRPALAPTSTLAHAPHLSRTSLTNPFIRENLSPYHKMAKAHTKGGEKADQLCSSIISWSSCAWIIMIISGNLYEQELHHSRGVRWYKLIIALFPFHVLP